MTLLIAAAGAALLQTQAIGNLTGLGKALVGVLVVFLAESSQRRDFARHGRFSTHFTGFLLVFFKYCCSSGRPCLRDNTPAQNRKKN